MRECFHSCFLFLLLFFLWTLAKKSLSQLRQLYFKMKDEVFGKTKGAGMSFNTAGLEKIFKREFTEHMCMDDVTYPRWVGWVVGWVGWVGRWVGGWVGWVGG